MTNATTRRLLLTGGRSRPIARVAISDACLARRYIHCQSCGDACAEQAISFAPRIGGPPLPTVAAAKCTGCGDCFTVCPASAIAPTPGAPRG
jgi:MinD superfamily P-loop ATPase